MEVFHGIDLNDSFILDWSFENNCLCFELEANVWPVSKYYAEPKLSEYTCYRKAIFQFTNAVSVSGFALMSQLCRTRVGALS